MKEIPEIKHDNFDLTEAKKKEIENDSGIEIAFDGRLITMTGDPESIKEIITKILEKDEENIRHKHLHCALKHIDSKSDFDLSDDILAPNHKMVRMRIINKRKKVEVIFGGGGNSISPEEMREEISKATELII